MLACFSLVFGLDIHIDLMSIKFILAKRTVKILWDEKPRSFCFVHEKPGRYRSFFECATFLSLLLSTINGCKNDPKTKRDS